MFSCQKITAEGAAYRRSGESVGEAQTFPGKAINVGGFNPVVPHVRKLIISELVTHDIDNVWLIGHGKETLT